MTSDAEGISPEALARALFERLAPLVPGELVFTRNGSRVRLTDPRGVWSEMDCRSFFKNAPEALEDAAERASHSVLSQVQDFVTEFLTEPWPEPPPTPTGSLLPKLSSITRGFACFMERRPTPCLSFRRSDGWNSVAETARAQPRQPPDRSGEFWGYPQSRTFAEVLIDWEEDRTLSAVLVGMLGRWSDKQWGISL